MSADERDRAASDAHASVTLTTRALWRVRAQREMPRYLLLAASAAGLAASARYAIAPPRAPRSSAVRSAIPAPDRSAEAYATLFARRYLSWDASAAPADHGLDAFIGSSMEAQAGLSLPSSGEQHVEWAEVVQVREAARGEHIFTIAAQTDTAGLLYLSVGVARAATGTLQLTGYPAFVGAPAAAPSSSAPRLREVDDPTLETVVERALRNYLGDSPIELEADLARGARVSPPALALNLESVQRLAWLPDGGSVTAVVRAQDGRGVHYTLAYQLDVVKAQGRWEVAAVQMDPNA